jgi:hypothetical protein
MNTNSRYLIDANVFIQAKNFHYRFGFCQAFWEWLIDAHQTGIVFSIDKVRKELNKGKKDDPVRTWMSKLPESFFIADIADSQVRQQYTQLMNWSTSNSHYLPQAKAEFASSDEADAFLVATALAHNFIIVTQEVSNPHRKNKVMLPDAADKFGVKNIFIYELLSQHAKGNFTLSL